jgi:hypothetical protein
LIIDGGGKWKKQKVKAEKNTRLEGVIWAAEKIILHCWKE